MVTDERLEPELNPVSVRRGSRTSHRMAWELFGFGVSAYGFIALSMLALIRFNPQQALFAPTVTLATDTALALLGLCATVLIALVAALWAAGHVSEAGLSRGRRRALTAVTQATGIGSVMVGAAGALHRPDEGWNFIISASVLSLGLVLAYITADVAVFVIEDRPLEQALRRHDADDRRARLRTARRNWLRQSRSARWKRHSNPVLARLRQTGAVLMLFAAVLTAALAATGGRSAVTGYLGWWLLDVAVGLLVGQFATHHLAIKFVARRWEPLFWHGLFGLLLYLPVSLLVQLQLLITALDDLAMSVPSGWVFVIGCWLAPLLVCLPGLTVAPRRWRRLRPMTQIRWSVIAAIGREIALIDKGSERDTEQARRLSPVSRLSRAARRATGAEEIPARTS
jgi:hypothetical protein